MIETQCLISRPARTDATEILVLLHPLDRLSPQGTQAWLARRPLAGHVHIRPHLPRDLTRLARLARLVSRNGVGLVLAGGGARGLAHIGIYRALTERGIEIDLVGGTSIGAVSAALVGTDGSIDAVTVAAQKAFASNPTGDFNWLPMISLIRGRRLRRVVAGSINELTGPDAQIEDLGKNFFCIATNLLMNVTVLYSTSRQREVRQLIDLYFNPPLQRIGMLQWSRFDELVQLGYQHAREVLDAQTPKKS